MKEIHNEHLQSMVSEHIGDMHTRITERTETLAAIYKTPSVEPLVTVAMVLESLYGTVGNLSNALDEVCTDAIEDSDVREMLDTIAETMRSITTKSCAAVMTAAVAMVDVDDEGKEALLKDVVGIAEMKRENMEVLGKLVGDWFEARGDEEDEDD